MPYLKFDRPVVLGIFLTNRKCKLVVYWRLKRLLKFRISTLSLWCIRTHRCDHSTVVPAVISEHLVPIDTTASIWAGHLFPQKHFLQTVFTTLCPQWDFWTQCSDIHRSSNSITQFSLKSENVGYISPSANWVKSELTQAIIFSLSSPSSLSKQYVASMQKLSLNIWEERCRVPIVGKFYSILCGFESKE